MGLADTKVVIVEDCIWDTTVWLPLHAYDHYQVTWRRNTDKDVHGDICLLY